MKKGRAMGILEPSRTIGDVDVKRLCPGAISPEPEVGIFDLKDLLSRDEASSQLNNMVGASSSIFKTDMFAIIASDGVFDVMDHYEAATCVTSSLADRRKEKTAAKILCQKAVRLGSKDDVTAVVVRFQDAKLVSQNR